MSLHNVGGRYWVFHRTLEPVTEEFAHYFYDANGNELSTTSSNNPIGISNPMLNAPEAIQYINCSTVVDGSYRMRFSSLGASCWGLYSWDYDLWGYILSSNDFAENDGADLITVDMFADIRTIQLYDGVYMDDAGYAFLTANAEERSDLNYTLKEGVYIFDKNIGVSLPSYLTAYALDISYRIGETALTKIHFQDDLALLYDGTQYYIGYQDNAWKYTIYRLVYIDSDQTVTPNAYFWFTENAKPPQIEDVSGTIWKFNDVVEAPAGYGSFEVSSTHSADGVNWQQNASIGLEYNFAFHIGRTDVGPDGEYELENKVWSWNCDGGLTYFGEGDCKYVRFFNNPSSNAAKQALLIIWLLDNAVQQHREPSEYVDLTRIGLPPGKYNFYATVAAPNYIDSEPSNILGRTFTNTGDSSA